MLGAEPGSGPHGGWSRRKQHWLVSRSAVGQRQPGQLHPEHGGAPWSGLLSRGRGWLPSWPQGRGGGLVIREG